jgi:hypothetical protein
MNQGSARRDAPDGGRCKDLCWRRLFLHNILISLGQEKKEPATSCHSPRVLVGGQVGVCGPPRWLFLAVPSGAAAASPQCKGQITHQWAVCAFLSSSSCSNRVGGWQILWDTHMGVGQTEPSRFNQEICHGFPEPGLPISGGPWKWHGPGGRDEGPCQSWIPWMCPSQVSPLERFSSGPRVSVLYHIHSRPSGDFRPLTHPTCVSVLSPMKAEWQVC